MNGQETQEGILLFLIKSVSKAPACQCPASSLSVAFVATIQGTCIIMTFVTFTPEGVARVASAVAVVSGHMPTASEKSMPLLSQRGGGILCLCLCSKWDTTFCLALHLKSMQISTKKNDME